jgi:hypothetical protein
LLLPLHTDAHGPWIVYLLRWYRPRLLAPPVDSASSPPASSACPCRLFAASTRSPTWPTPVRDFLECRGRPPDWIGSSLLLVCFMVCRESKKKCCAIVWYGLLLHFPVIFDGVRSYSILSVCLLFPLRPPSLSSSLCLLCHASPLYLHRQLVSSALVLYEFPWLVLHCRSTPIILVV